MPDEQLFTMPITEIIKKRMSVRTYLAQPIPSEMKDALRELFSSLQGPFGRNVRFNLIETELARMKSKANLGTYGVIRGASTYIVAVVEKSDHDLENYGYSFEKVILFATSLGLGTCWLGGTFKKSEFSKAIEQKDHEALPCISPIGYANSNKSLIDSAMRFVAGSKNRKKWDELFFSYDFKHHLSESAAGKYFSALEMLRLAPSASNKQPWRIVKDSDKCHFYLQHTKGYEKLMAFDLQRVDIGIAMCHFEMTAQEQGIEGKWMVSDPGNINTPQDTEYIVSWVESI